MSKDEQIREAIAQRAAEWFLANRSGSIDQADREQFFAWLKASPVHVEEYLGIAAAERGLAEAARAPSMTIEDLKRLALEDSSDRVVELAAPTAAAADRIAELVTSGGSAGAPAPSAEIMPSAALSEARPPRRRAVAFAAAAGVGAIALGVVWLLQAPSPAVAQTFRTSHGAQQEYPLADGSTLRLDSDSEVTVALSGSERLATLVRGQALFRVAHDARRSFRVRSGNVNAIAIGTEFDVYRRSESTLITVIEGQIAVSSAVSDTSADPSPALKVSAGQQVRIAEDPLSARAFPSAPSQANLTTATSWLEHKIAFEQLPLEEVAEEFNRYNAVQIAIEDQALRHLSVSGVFDATDIGSFTAFLASLDGVGVTRTPSSIAVFRRGRTAHTRPSR
jgi:transmembrane sensor